MKNGIKHPYGLCPASMTCWNADQTYNPKAEEKYMTWMLDNGATSISICGSTGENIATSLEEEKEIVEHVSSFLGGQVPLVVGTCRYDTYNTIKMAQYAQEKGADCIMSILPFYLHPHKKAVMQHFRDIHNAIDIDLLIYNNPWFAGYEMTTAEIKELNEEGTIQCIKAAHGDINRVIEERHACGDNLTIFYGHDYAAGAGILAGADGWLSGFPAILTKQCRAIYDAAKAKDVDAVNKAQENIEDFIMYFFYDKKDEVPHWQEICKYTLQAQGLTDVGVPRKPLGELDDANKKKIEKLLADMD